MKLSAELEQLKAQLPEDQKKIVDLIVVKAVETMTRSCYLFASIYHYNRLVSHPVGVNDPDQPDFKALAQEAIELAHKTTPAFFEALGEFDADAFFSELEQNRGET